ncbi:hypothetical protein BDN72DRAFT_726550, partial [Pluteus cervinus]
RTLVDITRSCVLTIGACVYRAIHPNIPDPEAPRWKVRLERFQVTILALIAPELVIFWAIRQWLGARLIMQEVNKVIEDNDIRGIEWTTTHSHFTQMGGFCQEGNKQVIFPSTLIQFMKEGRINLKGLRLSKDDINDRSKGDLLSKGFVILQTTWFVLECITRWATHLPLTELEVVTLAYATLNIVTYGFWLHKPLNVNRPNYLEVYPAGRSTDDVPAQADQILEEKRGEGVDTATVVKVNPENSMSVPTIDYAPISDDIQVSSWKDITSGLYWGIDRPLIDLMFSRVRKLVRHGRKADIHVPGQSHILTRLLVVIFNSLLKRPFCYACAPFLDLVDESTVDTRRKYVPCYYALKIPASRWWIMWYPSCTIAFIFASVHFLSWNSHFPSPIEQTLWRLSSVTLLAVPFDLLVLGVVFDVHDRWVLTSGKRTRVILQVLCLVLAVFSVVFVLLTYTFARACLLIEAVVALREVPQGAYEGILWTSIIPH